MSTPPTRAEKHPAAGSLLWLSALLLAALVNLTAEVDGAVLVSGMLMLVFFPGAFLVRLMTPAGEMDYISRLFLSFFFSLLLNGIGFLLLCYALDNISTLVIVSLEICFGVIFTALRLIKRPGPRPAIRRHSRWNRYALILLLLAGFFRFAHLGYSEFQGDEAGNCMYNSVQLVRGNHAVITHPVATAFRRPPVQALIPAVSYYLTRTFDEGVARFPFALASLATVWFLYVLGRDIFARPLAGWVAGFFAAINGYFVAYGRIVQYQSVVTLGMVLSMLFLWRFMRSEYLRSTQKHLFLAMVAFAFTVLTHFEALIFIPVALYALVYKSFRMPWKPFVKAAAGAGLVFCLLIGLFYIPFLMDASSGAAISKHWASRHGSSLRFHYELLLTAIPFYTSSIYLAAMAVLAPFALLSRQWNPIGIVSCWFLSFFIYYMVLAELPNTHVYTYFPAWAALAGLGFSVLFERASRLFSAHSAAGRVVLLGFPAVLAVIALSTCIRLYTMFVNHSPEYAWSHQRHELPIRGIFGFPYYRGWKTAGALFRTRQFDGRYRSNEKWKITLYYLRRKRSKHQDVRYLLKTTNPQIWVKDLHIPKNFNLAARITFRGQPTILIYEKDRMPGNVKDYRADELDGVFAELDKTAP